VMLKTGGRTWIKKEEPRWLFGETCQRNDINTTKIDTRKRGISYGEEVSDGGTGGNG